MWGHHELVYPELAYFGESNEVYKKPGNVPTQPKTYENGDTKKELLARSRYLLFQFETKWSASQKERAAILFREFPEIKRAYRLMCHFRHFYQVKVGEMALAKEKLKAWQAEVSQEGIEEMLNFSSTIIAMKPQSSIILIPGKPMLLRNHLMPKFKGLSKPIPAPTTVISSISD